MKFNIKRLVLLIITIVVFLGYYLLNQSNNAHYLATALDNQIPLISVFIIPYILFLPFFFWVVLIYAFFKKKEFVPLALSTIIVYLFSYLVYHFFQTCVYRPPIEAHNFLLLAVKYLYSIDKPCNDFPSLHNASVAILAVYFYATNNKYKIWYLVFGFVVVLATLFLKQHNMIDVAAGLFLGFVVSYLTFRQFK